MKIQAKVSDRILKKADSFFTGSVSGRITEILQNARRAGATRVDITQSEEWVRTGDNWDFVQAEVTVTDNGTGVDDWNKLLHLGASGWGDEMEAAEDPAGIGLFSLAPRAVTVQSNGKYAVIEGDAWYGGSEIEVRDDVSPDRSPDRVEKGTRVRFMDTHWGHRHLGTILHGYHRPQDRVPDFDENRRRPSHAMITAGAFGNMTVAFNGVEVPRGDFLLEDFGLIRHIPELGCKIQVVLSHDHMESASRSFDQKPRSAPHFAVFGGRLPEATLNFHGQLVDLDTRRGRSELDLPRWHDTDRSHYLPRYHARPDYSVLVEMTGEPTPLKLMLPARTQVVKDEALDRLHEEIVRSALLFIKSRGSHRLPFFWWERARSLGIEDFPESVPVYSSGASPGERGMMEFPYGYHGRNHTASVRHGCVFDDVGIIVHEPDGITYGNPDVIFGDDHDFTNTFEDSDPSILLEMIDTEDVVTDDDGEGDDFDIISIPPDYGYSWAQGQDRIELVVIHVPKEIGSWSLWCSTVTVVEHIKAEVGFASGRVEIVNLPAAFHCCDSDCNPDVIVSLNTLMNDTGLLFYLLGGYSEDESTEEQDRVFNEEVEAIQHELVGPREANRVAAVEFARENHYGAYPKTFVVDADGTVTVTDGNNRRERWLPDGEVLTGDAIKD